MELFKPTNLKKDLQTWLPQGGLILAAALFSIIWLVLFGLERESGESIARGMPFPSIDHRTIGKGTFAISPRGVSPEFEPLINELVVLGKNTRPDGGAFSTITIGLKTSGDQEQLVSGQKLFVSTDGSRYQFASEKTDLSLLPLPMAGSDVLLQIETPDKKEEVVLKASAFLASSLDEETYVQVLKKGKMWAPDLFLHQWGGDEYRDLSAKQKVEIDNKVYFLSVGDLLWWDQCEWKVGKAVLQDAPLAKFVSSSGQGMHFEVWNPTGYISSSIEIALQSSKPPQKAEEAITSVRPRSNSEITCQLGKRRVIVKEGDWWLKTDRRWRSLKTAEDLEAFLLHDIQGELFIFEKVENMKGKTILKGRCFDKMRTESLPISLVVNTEKKSPPSSGKSGSPQQPIIAKNKMTISPLQHQNSEGEEK
ncbi:MAG TPA: hypothetical protein VHK67_06875 [Rhabdochlamydiaceae bacterium]|jgi:hypothetical protein|nr:hypothetical protein [Rhabdochlamydiaceae bacterium]